MTTIGAYEAKTHFAQLLDQVAAGGTVTITRHDAPVARLVPIGAIGVTDVVAAFRDARRGLRLAGVSVRELIDEGRR